MTVPRTGRFANELFPETEGESYCGMVDRAGALEPHRSLPAPRTVFTVCIRMQMYVRACFLFRLFFTHDAAAAAAAP